MIWLIFFLFKLLLFNEIETLLHTYYYVVVIIIASLLPLSTSRRRFDLSYLCNGLVKCDDIQQASCNLIRVTSTQLTKQFISSIAN